MQTGTNFSENFQTIYKDERSFLEKTVEDCPASPFSLFLLLQNYKSTGDPRFNDLVKKAAVYFPNAVWLNYQLSGDELMNNEKVKQISEAEEVTTISEVESSTEIGEDPEPENDIISTEIPASENIVEKEAIHEMEEEEKVEFVQGEKIAGLEDAFVEKETTEDTILEDTLHEEETLPEKQTTGDERRIGSEETETIDTKPAIELQEETVPEIDSPHESEETDDSVSTDTESAKTATAKEEIEVEAPGPSTEVQESHNEEVLGNEDSETSDKNYATEVEEEAISGTDTSQDSEVIDNSESTSSEIEETPSSEQEKKLRKFPGFSTSPELQNKKENQELEFEPLHTIDYFASQGIIIREEALMDDKLGKQVKSFTDWLKSMKKLHPGKLPEQNEVVERIIQSSAELSNEDAGILTESMAEVLLKQGKKGKAIEMFEKLSLMNPSKSSYFAAKIEILKNK